MIFVAVGTQFPFDRLIRYVDEWAAQHQAAGIAQIADGAYLPQQLRWERFMATNVFNQHLRAASLIISHAGMGNIITALENRKPIIVMNRQHALGEHRNDHQLDGLEWMGRLPGVYTAATRDALYALLEQQHELTPASTDTYTGRQALTDFIDQAIRA
ncbi:glycosyltransferase [Thiothrix nivea]|uniref:Glycosyltransferase 28 domain-containing protein n=1 Tax=Thiothrix nivea (strain ATCC 35100 / DSM 5205 / JP2) TaxID=870187 RepID=A0A656HM89_THINJ|nr:glycosyltransferase [Thiothrix nivea]EIJ36646.1 Glycosyltransferase 28 domain-containing protein [Thiothrix nivea DSM 5205]